jgi:Fic family protein
MPKKISEKELAEIERLICSHPEGISIAELGDSYSKAFQKTINRRTLQRRLALLIEKERVESKGETRGVRYHLKTPKEPTTILNISGAAHGHSAAVATLEAYIPVSTEGGEIRDYVQQPLHMRKPVGYQREYLNSYQPNETTYLTDVIREHLNHIGRSPLGDRPAGTYARQILNRLLIDFSWASSRLEGNTYSLLDTERLIDFAQSAEGKDQKETQMILNHKAAIEFMVESADEIGFNRYTILNLHALLSDNLLPNPDGGGKLRSIPVGIQQSTYLPLAMPQLLEECFQQILDTAKGIQDPFEQAFFVMVHLPYLQPFEDVNKRVSRLAANIPLIRQNLCPLSFIDVPERAYTDGILGVYELNRMELLRDVFIWAYERSCQKYLVVRQSLGEPDPFKLKYRQKLIEAIGNLIQFKLPVDLALKEYAVANIPEKDRTQFVQVAVDEIAKLHEGNIARYRLRPSQFAAWQETTKKE